ncbi:T9SS sorting signal type C domain-containing protein [Flavobacterium gawalongense]|uniref:T9SS sorting signal type C domain-containing protein n=1 Tax=Flavobacterium gawalongense TaxID=2594432 RepID=A0ABY3CL10_9FLAO|nr:T9SS sorting signal type C domain-containing protein [Flavobacterium gawalongense]TRX01891.1 T9SS sorting signal type C domain-containing protein [Flavobacterium gawalongense]TRX06345.1 T9SS sorting signal type C domain-containing protein [Flavobacterium gawalongense]
MKTLLHKSGVFIIVLLLFAFSGIVNAQCPTITGNVNSSTLTSSSFASCGGIINIGNGSTPTTLYMNAELNLTSLGAIQLIVRSGATLDFSSGNNRLYLKEGSSIIIQSGEGLVGGSCNASERIYIGTNLLASCNGGAGADVSFADIVTLGGTGSATSNSPVCVGNPINLSAASPPNGGPYTYSWSGPGITAPTYSNSPNYTLSATVSGIYQVKMKSTMLNTSVTPNVPFIMIAETTVTVNTGLSTAAPTASVTLQPTCSTPTGTITITAPTAVGMTYSINGLTYTNTTGVFTSVAIGTYSVTAKNSSGCISPGTSVIIALPTKTWGGSSWSPSAPTSADNIVFNGSYSSSSDLAGCSCQVATGTVVINPGHTLTLTNGLTVSGGSLTFENNASLVQINDAAVNTGNITYKRKTTPVGKFDYTYWSSPVSPQSLYNVSPNTASDTFFSFDATVENWKQENSASVMSVGIGYIIRGPEGNLSPAIYEAFFIGVPNNGAKSLTGIGADRSYLLGNPYPSALDADKFLLANNTVLDGTIYFWTHNTPIAIGTPNPGSGLYAYSSDDYASYNGVGGTETLSAVSGGVMPSGKIAAGQGFFTSSQLPSSFSGTTIVFNNSMRVVGNNSQFYKHNTESNTKSANSVVKNRIWLNLTNAQGLFKQTLLGYVTGATNGLDSSFDGESFNGNQYADFYSIIQDKNLVIQGRALPFDENDMVPLGYSVTIAGGFTISIDQTDGVLANQEVFIEDKKTNVIHDLKQGPYSFTTEKGTFNDRFVLRYTNKAEIGKSFNIQENVVLVSNKNRQIEINSSVETINKVQMYDLSGRLIYQKRNVNTNELAIFNLVQNHQTLLIKIVLQNGQTVTKKIVN